MDVKKFFMLSFIFLFLLSPASYALNQAVFINSHQSPLTEPNLKYGQLKIWVKQAVLEIYNFDHKNFTTHMKSTAQFFTPKGWTAFNKSQEKSAIPNLVKYGKLSVSGKITGPIEIQKEGIVNNKYQWIVTVPVDVIYTKADKPFEHKTKLTLTISRTPDLAHKFNHGVGIEAITS